MVDRSWLRRWQLAMALVSGAVGAGCQSPPSAPSAEPAPVLAYHAGNELDFFDQLAASPRATWGDLLTGALLVRRVPAGALRGDEAVIAQAQRFDLLGQPAQAVAMAEPVTVKDVATVASRTLSEPVHDDADARRAITRLDALGVMPPGTQPAWNVAGEQLLSVLAALNDQFERLPPEARPMESAPLAAAANPPPASAPAPVAVMHVEPAPAPAVAPPPPPPPAPAPAPPPPPSAVSAAPPSQPWVGGRPIGAP